MKQSIAVAAILIPACAAHVQMPEARLTLASGQAVSSTIAHTRHHFEKYFELPADSAGSSATVIRADAERACFDITENNQDELDADKSKFYLQIDARPPIATAEVTSDPPTIHHYDATDLAKKDTGETRCTQHWDDGSCHHAATEKVTKTEIVATSFDFHDYVFHACFATPPIIATSQTLVLKVEYHLVVKPDETKMDDEFYVVKDEYRWGFGAGKIDAYVDPEFYKPVI